MPRHSWSPAELDERFQFCLKGSGRGLTYGKVAKVYGGAFHLSERTAKAHLALLNAAMERGEVHAVGKYRGPEGWLYGDPNDPKFEEAKGDAERKSPQKLPDSIFHLGGRYNDSPMSLEWTNCPETGRIVRAQVVTMGLADFMRCPICNWFHFLGVSPKMQDQRVYGWQVDPLVNWQEYADELSTSLQGDPVTFKAQKSRIERIRKGGRYVGLRYRSSWDFDPIARLRELDPEHAPREDLAAVPVRAPPGKTWPTGQVRYVGPRNTKSRRKRKGRRLSVTGR